MKKSISGEELTREIKKWMASFTKEEWREKLEEEKYLYELKNLEWLIKDVKDEIKVINKLFDIEVTVSTNEDEEVFSWASYLTFEELDKNIKISNKEYILSLTPISYEESLHLKAAA